jgi:hypothetical protein
LSVGFYYIKDEEDEIFADVKVYIEIKAFKTLGGK